MSIWTISVLSRAYAYTQCVRPYVYGQTLWVYIYTGLFINGRIHVSINNILLKINYNCLIRTHSSFSNRTSYLQISLSLIYCLKLDAPVLLVSLDLISSVIISTVKTICVWSKYSHGSELNLCAVKPVLKEYLRE